jgi:hypothetical protein
MASTERTQCHPVVMSPSWRPKLIRFGVLHCIFTLHENRRLRQFAVTSPPTGVNLRWHSKPNVPTPVSRLIGLVTGLGISKPGT